MNLQRVERTEFANIALVEFDAHTWFKVAAAVANPQADLARLNPLAQYFET